MIPDKLANGRKGTGGKWEICLSDEGVTVTHMLPAKLDYLNQVAI